MIGSLRRANKAAEPKPKEEHGVDFRRLNINQLVMLTGRDRKVIVSKLQGIPFVLVKSQSKTYEAKTALEVIYCGGTQTENFVSNAEATRQLTVARKDQIDLEMEVTRKQRIPLETLEEINDSAFSNVAGMIKAHEGKMLTAQAIGDMLGELRGIGHALREASR